MKKISMILLLSLIVTNGIFGQNTFTLSSKDLRGEATKIQEFKGFGYAGGNHSPQLSWKNAPEDTKYFAITVYDPNAPTTSGFGHRVVFDIPENVNELLQNASNISLNLSTNGAIQSKTDYGIYVISVPYPFVNPLIRYPGINKHFF